MPVFRRPGPPAQARQVAAHGERVIAWGRDGLGQPVVATTVALYVPGRSGDHERLPYETIAAAVWADPTLELTLVGRSRLRHLVRLDEPGEIPPVVRERVTASIALSEHIDLGGGGGARITARRVPGEDGLTWNVVFDPGLDASDPALRARADAAIAQLRSSTGL
ncbi:MAG TPA: hypothetical protein VIJ54_06645 [Actinomycetes bacterium]